MNKEIVQQSLLLEPGKTIESLEGEILSVHFSQWGTYGKVKVDNKNFNYKLKNSDTTNNIVVGLDLIIKNGFCIRNKKGDLVVTEGKFGSANAKFRIKRYYKKRQDEEDIVTGVIKSIKERLENVILEVELFLPPHKEIRCIIGKNNIKETEVVQNFNQIIKGSVVRIEGEKKDTHFHVESIEILPKNHFWYIFLSVKKDSQEQISSLYQIMNNQIEIVNSFYETFKDILFNIGKDVSKTTLVSLRDLLHSKIFNGELVFPYNILISEDEIKRYFNKMIEFCRDYIYANKNLNGPEDILLLIRNFYPEYKI
jgi:hypothetical protein